VGIGSAERAADELKSFQPLERILEAVAEVEEVEGESEEGGELDGGRSRREDRGLSVRDGEWGRRRVGERRHWVRNLES
jgi:hypothetical protein